MREGDEMGRKIFLMMLMLLSVTMRVYGAEAVSPGFGSVDVNAGDGLCGDVITSTVHDEVNTVQVNFHSIMPEGFTLGTCVELYSAGTGNTYQILATSANEYLGKMYLPKGFYIVLDCYVVGDNISQYPLTIPADFTAEEGKTYLLECSLANAEGVSEKAAEVPEESDAEEVGVLEESSVGAEPYAVPAAIFPWREVVHEGEGSAEIVVEGISRQPVELVVEITGSGGYRKGEYRYSTDNGITWSDVLVISNALARVEDTATGAYTGLNLSFEGMEYLIYDLYRFCSRIEYDQESKSRNGEGVVNFFSDEVIYDKDYHIEAKIVKTGGLGEGEFAYRINGGLLWSEAVQIPADGFYRFEDTGIQVQFFENNGTFMVGDVFETNIKGDMSKRNYMPFIVVLLAVVLVVLVLVNLHYTSQRDGADRYELRRYEKL